MHARAVARQPQVRARPAESACAPHRDAQGPGTRQAGLGSETLSPFATALVPATATLAAPSAQRAPRLPLLSSPCAACMHACMHCKLCQAWRRTRIHPSVMCTPRDIALLLRRTISGVQCAAAAATGHAQGERLCAGAVPTGTVFCRGQAAQAQPHRRCVKELKMAGRVACIYLIHDVARLGQMVRVQALSDGSMPLSG